MLSRDDDCTLVIMAKAPKPGRVKTRLAQSLPLTAVTAFYRCLLDDTVTLARSLGNVEVAIMCPGSDLDELACLAGDEVCVVAQKGEVLAAGLTSVFAHFAAGHQRAGRGSQQRTAPTCWHLFWKTHSRSSLLTI